MSHNYKSITVGVCAVEIISARKRAILYHAVKRGMFAQQCTATCHAVTAAVFTLADGNEADLTVYGNVFVRPLATSSATSSGRRRLQQTGAAQCSDLGRTV